MLLLATAAGIALVLGAVGIYGVLAYVVTQRRMEIGVRMALGARSAQVRNMVLAQSLQLAAAGIAIGLVAALAFTRLLASLLHEVSPTDPVTFAAVSGLLVAVAAAASYLPATRAARVEPMRTLRGE
jgi:ABC-type antimicrobial peptide transport system permease subunit